MTLEQERKEQLKKILCDLDKQVDLMNTEDIVELESVETEKFQCINTLYYLTHSKQYQSTP